MGTSASTSTSAAIGRISADSNYTVDLGIISRAALQFAEDRALRLLPLGPPGAPERGTVRRQGDFSGLGFPVSDEVARIALQRALRAVPAGPSRSNSSPDGSVEAGTARAHLLSTAGAGMQVRRLTYGVSVYADPRGGWVAE